VSVHMHWFYVALYTWFCICMAECYMHSGTLRFVCMAECYMHSGTLRLGLLFAIDQRPWHHGHSHQPDEFDTCRQSARTQIRQRIVQVNITRDTNYKRFIHRKAPHNSDLDLYSEYPAIFCARRLTRGPGQIQRRIAMPCVRFTFTDWASDTAFTTSQFSYLGSHTEYLL
jgi:hypothetical protein